MFTGIIEHLGQIKAITPQQEARIFTLTTGIEDLALGESIAINGVCLTVTTFDKCGLATFFASAETLSKTALDATEVSQWVNLERACTPTTRLSGHLVQGHVDAVGHIVTLAQQGESFLLRVALPQSLRRYVVPKGSITLDGISLTINEIQKQDDGAVVISLMIIPHTWQHTTLKNRKSGDALNIEVDVLAKYVDNLLQKEGRI